MGLTRLMLGIERERCVASMLFAGSTCGLETVSLELFLKPCEAQTFW